MKNRDNIVWHISIAKPCVLEPLWQPNG
jgi:hypothetical protein